MTTVAGLIRDGRIWIASDDQVTLGNLKVDVPNFKVFRHLDALWGVTGDIYDRQVLLTKVKKIDRDNEMTDYEYLVRIVNDWRAALQEVEGSPKYNEKRYSNSQALIGYHSKLYTVGSDYSLLPIDRCYHALGSGGEVALGALQVLRRYLKHPEQILADVIDAAHVHDINTGATHSIVTDAPVDTDVQESQTRQLNGTSQSRPEATSA